MTGIVDYRYIHSSYYRAVVHAWILRLCWRLMQVLFAYAWLGKRPTLGLHLALLTTIAITHQWAGNSVD